MKRVVDNDRCLERLPFSGVSSLRGRQNVNCASRNVLACKKICVRFPSFYLSFMFAQISERVQGFSHFTLEVAQVLEVFSCSPFNEVSGRHFFQGPCFLNLTYLQHCLSWSVGVSCTFTAEIHSADH